MKLIIWFIIIYLLYKLIVEFVVPIGKATSQMHHAVKEMQQERQKQANQEAYNQQSSYNTNAAKPKNDDDYIEFEEIKN